DFLTSNKVWIATDRSRARRCVEACVYGTLDFVGYPRFPAPVEFIAAVIAYYVHPVNIQTACLIMEGAEFTYHLLEGFPFIQEPPSGDLQERVLIRHHDYDQCFQSVQLLQWNSQVKFNVTVYRNLPTTRDSIMTS